MKKNLKKVLAVFCAFAISLGSSGIQNITGTNGLSEVKAEENVTKFGWKELGVTKDTTYETNAQNQLIGVASMDTHLNMEFEGIVNFGSSSGAVRFLFSGKQKSLAFCVQANKDGSVYLSWRGKDLKYLNLTGNKICNQTLQEVDLIVNIKMAFVEDVSDATKSKGSIGLTLKNALSGETLYNETFNNLEAPTTELQPMAYAYTNGGKLNVKLQATEPSKIGWTDLGVTQDTVYQTSGSNQPIGTATIDDSLNMEFEGIINLGSSGGRVRFLFSGDQKSKAFCIQGNADKSVYLSWRGKDIKYLNLEGSSQLHHQIPQYLQNVDLLINIKLLFAKVYNDPTQSYGTLVVTLKDAATNIELYKEAFHGLTAPTAELKPMAYVNTSDAGTLTAKFPVTRIGWNELGITENTTYTTLGQNQKIGSATTNDFSNIEFEGIIHVASTDGKVQFGFGGSSIENAFKMQVNSVGKTYLFWKNSPIKYINSGEGTVILSQSLQDVDLIINLKMAFAAIDAINSRGKITVTLTDATSGIQLYTETFNDKEIATADLVAKAWVYTEDAGALRVKFDAQPTTKIIVGGSDTNTSAFPVMVENGGTLPTGYMEDGKYILGWSIGETEVTTYDNTQEAPVAKYVDTKMLTVLQQNDGASPMDVRFIASLNKLEGYAEAGFVFSNNPLVEEENLVIGGSGRVVPLSTAYKKLNAKGASVTASEIYKDAYSQYFIAYALTDIPTEQGVVISARAYVKIDDTVIYGNMARFEIDKLEP